MIAHHHILLSPEQKWHQQSLHLTVGSSSAVQMERTKSLTKKVKINMSQSNVELPGFHASRPETELSV